MVQLDGKQPTKGAWPEGERRLRDWFLLHRSELPREPFDLSPHQRVVAPDTYYRFLEQCIDLNYLGWYDATVQNLRRLRELFGGAP